MTAPAVPDAVDRPTVGIGDRAVVLVAMAAWAGAWWAAGRPSVVAAGGVATGWPFLVGPVAGVAAVVAQRARSALGAAVAVAVLATWSGTHAWERLRSPDPGPFSAVVTLVDDPADVSAGVRVRAAGPFGRVELWARGPAAAELRAAGAGSRVEVIGSFAPRSGAAIAAWPSARVVGSVAVGTATVVDGGALHWRAAAAVRGLLERGAEGLEPEESSLLRGLVVGDDRDQGAVVRDAFDAAGLTHLLAVSGQNVAFVLVAVGPLLRRLRPWPRLAVAAVVLGLFATVTRFEPSVLRAVGMAGLGLFAWTLGRPADARRLLALTVTVLVVVDPLLVRSLGFRLSVAATAAIVVAAAPLAARLRGPGWFRLGVAVPLVAQFATAPLLASVGAGVPVLAVPANLLAEPAAAFVMTWGSSVGLLAGVVGGGAAEVLHVPTRVALGWIDGVARIAAHLPVGSFGGATTTAVAAGLAILVIGRQRLGRSAGVVGGLLVAGGFLAAGLSAGAAPGPVCGLPTGVVAVTSHDGNSIVVVDRAVDGGRVLRALRAGGVRRVEVLAVSTAAPGAVRAIEPLLDRFDPPLVVGPARHERFVTPTDGARITIDDVTLVVSVRSGTTSFSLTSSGTCGHELIDVR